MKVVVQHGREKVVRRCDRMEVAGEVQVDFIHRHNLRVPTPCGTTLHTEDRAEAWLADADYHLLAQPTERLTDADGHRALPLASWSGVDAGDEHQPTFGPAPRDRLGAYLGLVPAVRENLLRTESHLSGNVRDGTKLRRLCNGNVGGDRGYGSAHGRSSQSEVTRQASDAFGTPAAHFRRPGR
jgi:hypothetical protein